MYKRQVVALLEAKGFNGRVYDLVLVVVNRFSKIVRYFPVTTTINAISLVDLIYDKIIMFIGDVNDIVSDRGSVFISDY